MWEVLVSTVTYYSVCLPANTLVHPYIHSSLWQVTQLKKANDCALEAVKGKVFAEAQNRNLEERLQEASEKLCSADEKLRETEMHKQLLQREAQSYRDDAKEAQQQLLLALDKLHLNEDIAREKVQKVEGERAALESRVAELQAEMEMSRRDREEVVTSLEQQLKDSRKQQQTVQEELKRLQKEMGEKCER